MANVPFSMMRPQRHDDIALPRGFKHHGGGCSRRSNLHDELGILMNRRYLLGAASSWFVAPSKLSAAGKPIFLGYDQEELDKAYDQSFWAPQMEQLETGDGTASAAVRKATPR